MTDTLRAAWDAHAADYARVFAPVTGFIAQNMFRMTAARLPAQSRILDVACGAGELTIAAALHARSMDNAPSAHGTIWATDFSAEMIALTEQAVAAHGVAEFVRCEVHDGQQLALADETFDAVFSSFGIFLFPDRQAGWREAARVLRPGGMFVTSVWRDPEHNALARQQMAPLLASLPPRLLDLPPRPDWIGLLSAEGLMADVCGAAPFVDPEISVISATLVVPHPFAMWDAMQGNPVTNRLLVGCTADELADVARAVVAHFEALAGGAHRPLLLDASAHVLVARRG
ncbi:MAG: methyltransferase domain-containing protein [Gemmatimonadaceae bacterium]|jgi:SAM-dependent methyltransferase|nr:methyltransferase domain-containing protein [Gemmatimonadaceae bacterium]